MYTNSYAYGNNSKVPANTQIKMQILKNFENKAYHDMNSMSSID